jgi:hypothetical protein
VTFINRRKDYLIILCRTPCI